MSIYDDVMEARRQANIPVRWCQIFANVLMKVEARLGIKLKVYPFRDCIFVSIEPGIITIKPPSNYSQASSDNLRISGSANLNITGWDYNGYEPDELVFLTEVGYRNYWYNEYLFPKLLRNKKLRDAIVDHYSPCYFERFIRINKIQKFVYQWIENYPGTYQDFEDYIKTVIDSGIYYSNMTPDECIDKFKDLGVPSDRCDEIGAKLSHSSYNWLEYLKIVTPPLNFKRILAEASAEIEIPLPFESNRILAEDSAEIEISLPLESNRILAEGSKELDAFEKQIWIHLTGMILIDQIYQCQETPREINKMLNTFAAWLNAHPYP